VSVFDSQLRLGTVFAARALATAVSLVQIAVSVEVDCAQSCSSTANTCRNHAHLGTETTSQFIHFNLIC
jgi:hypothetical protein